MWFKVLFVILALGPTAAIGSGLRGLQQEGKELCAPVAACLEKLDRGEECDLLPVPERAKLSILPDGQSYELTELRDGVFAFNDGGYLALIIVTNDWLTVVDFPETSTTPLLNAIDEVLGDVVPTRIHMIYSHGHYDHIGGGQLCYDTFKEKFTGAQIEVWGTRESRRLIRESKTDRAPQPDKVILKEGRVLTLKKGIELNFILVGGHMHQDMLIYIAPSGTMPGIAMHVDVVFPRWAPWPNLALSEDLTGFIEAHHKLLEYDFEFFIGGHIRVGTKADVEESLRFTEDLFEAGEVAVATTTFDDFVASGYGRMFDPNDAASGNVWFGFVEAVRGPQTDACYRIMMEKWGCEIGALDITLRTHCFMTVQYALLEA